MCIHRECTDSPLPTRSPLSLMLGWSVTGRASSLYVRTWNFPALVMYLMPLKGLYFSPYMSSRFTFSPVEDSVAREISLGNVRSQYQPNSVWLHLVAAVFPYNASKARVCVPEMAICWILNWILMVGFSSGFEAPACRLMVPFRLGSFCGLIFPTSQDNIYNEK